MLRWAGPVFSLLTAVGSGLVCLEPGRDHKTVEVGHQGERRTSDSLAFGERIRRPLLALLLQLPAALLEDREADANPDRVTVAGHVESRGLVPLQTLGLVAVQLAVVDVQDDGGDLDRTQLGELCVPSRSAARTLASIISTSPLKNAMWLSAFCSLHHDRSRD